MRLTNTAVLLSLALGLGAVVAPAQTAPKKVSPSEAMGAIATKVQPEYPPIAKQLRIEGKVELQAVVAENGTVEDVSVLSGNPVLTKPAAAAVKRWKFTPFTDAGKPVKALAPLSLSFKL